MATEMPTQESRRGDLPRVMGHSTDREEEISRHFPPLPRRVSGYNLDELLKPAPFNLAPHSWIGRNVGNCHGDHATHRSRLKGHGVTVIIL